MKFSIVIPTRDRSDTLRSTLMSCKNCNYTDVEFIIVDNFGDKKTNKVVAEFLDDQRFTYTRTTRRLPMSENWAYGISLSTGDYISVLGDDDALLQDSLINAKSLFDRFNVNALRSSSVNFKWPTISESNVSSTYFIPSLFYRSKIVQTREAIRLCLNGYRYYSYLPVIYNGGFVKRDILESIARYNDSNLIPCRNPDVYIGVAIALTIDNYLMTELPMVVNGASHHSNGTANHTSSPNSIIKRMYEDKNGPSQIFLSEQNIPFDKNLLQDESDPTFNIQIAMYDALYKTKKLPKYAYYHATYTLKDLVESCIRVPGKSKTRTDNWINLMVDSHGFCLTQNGNSWYFEKINKKLSLIPKLLLKLTNFIHPRFSNAYEASLYLSKLIKFRF